MTVDDAMSRVRASSMEGDKRVLIIGLVNAGCKLADEVERLREENEQLRRGDMSFREMATGESEDLEESMKRFSEKGGVAAISGKWPGDEMDEEIAEALKKLS